MFPNQLLSPLLYKVIHYIHSLNDAGIKNKNRVKYTQLMEKVLEQFREAVVKEIKKMKL